MSEKGRTLPLDLGPANDRKRRNLAVGARSGEGRLTEQRAVARPRPRERALMPETVEKRVEMRRPMRCVSRKTVGCRVDRLMRAA